MGRPTISPTRQGVSVGGSMRVNTVCGWLGEGGQPYPRGGVAEVRLVGAALWLGSVEFANLI